MCSIPLFQVSRSDFSVTSELADKSEKFVQCEEEGGVKKVSVEAGQRGVASLTQEQAVSVARLLVGMEGKFGRPQDFEWAMEAGKYVSACTNNVSVNFMLCVSLTIFK